jgi:hypothetical protein
LKLELISERISNKLTTEEEDNPRLSTFSSSEAGSSSNDFEIRSSKRLGILKEGNDTNEFKRFISNFLLVFDKFFEILE